MRISDWSSDVCSSDLRITIARGVFRNHGCRRRRRGQQIGFASRRRRADCGRRAVKRVGVATADRTEFAPAQEISVLDPQQIGSASCRERLCQYVEITVAAVSLKKKIYN